MSASSRPALRDRIARGDFGRASVALVALLLGILVVVQLRTQAAGTGLELLTNQELTVLVGNLNTRNDQLRNEVTTLRGQAAALETARRRGETSIGSLQADLARVRAWAGLDPIQGRGARLTVDGLIDGVAIEEILNELRNAGAEAIAIEGVRIVAGVVVAGIPGELTVGNAAITAPFEIEVIGDPGVITGTLTRAGGVIAQLGATYPDARITVTPVERMILLATDRSLSPVLARPGG